MSRPIDGRDFTEGGGAVRGRRDPFSAGRPAVSRSRQAGKDSSTVVPCPGAERMRASPPLWRTKP